ncbi:MAG: oligosaccharide repeat unit polymerase [Clostridiales bacterium]|nr:oligosaccharide repeat unit polymerase [Clostridiales bacterium]
MDAMILLFVGETILLILAYVITGNDILAPSVLMCIMFVISTFVAILNFANWEYGTTEYSMQATLLILTGLFCFIAAETLTRILINKSKQKGNRGRSINQNKKVTHRELKTIDISAGKIVIVIFFDIVVCVLYYYAIREVVGTSYSGMQVFAAYRRLGVSDMSGEDVTRVSGLIPQLTNVVVVSGYVAGYVLINNLLFGDRNKRRQLGLVIIVILSLLPGTMVAGRTQYLRIFIGLLFYYYILWNQKHHWKKNLSYKMIRIGIIALAVGIPAFYYSLNLLGRLGNKRTMFQYVSSYLGSSIFLFGKYVENPVSRTLWGEESLVGIRKILSFLGVGAASTSYNLEFRSVGAYTSNVYTFFRRPLHDFGLVGMYIFTALVAVFFAYMYWGKIKGAARNHKTNMWVLSYGYLFYWIFVSSISQYSQSILTIGTAVKIILLLLGYWFVTKVHLKLRFQKFVIMV